MRGFLRAVLLVLVLLAVALMSALTAMRIAIHGREVEVPKLVGMSTAQAERLANERGLRVEVENRFYSTDLPEGRIMSQLPPPGSKVRRGWRVRLAESLGQQHIVVPDVIGQSTRAAELNLRRRGLEVATLAIAHVPDQPPDQVIAQTPPPNASGASSNKVSLLVSAPEEPPAFVMPNFVGRSWADAKRAVEAAGLRVGNGRPAAAGDASQPANVIVKQSPPPGHRVTAGSLVEFEISH